MNSPAWPTCAAHATQRARESAVARIVSHAEMARDGETPRALTFLQNRPRTSPELQLSTNTISPLSQTFSLNPVIFP